VSSSFSHSILPSAIKVLDLAVVGCTSLAAFALTSAALTWPSFTSVLALRIKVVNLFLLVGYCTICLAVFSLCGFYRSHRLSRWDRRTYEVVVAVTLITGILLLLRVPFQLLFASNDFLCIFWFVTSCALILSREAGQQLLYRARVHGKNLRNAVVIGDGAEAFALADRITQEPSLGYHVLQIIDAQETVDDDQARRTG